MAADGVGGDKELLGHFSIGESLSHELCNRELGVRHRRPACWRPVCGDEAPVYPVRPQAAPNPAGVPGATGLGVNGQRAPERREPDLRGTPLYTGDSQVLERRSERKWAGAVIQELDGARTFAALAPRRHRTVV